MSDAAELDLPHIDTTRPSIARVYDAALGGKDNYEIDRIAYRKILAITPEVPLLARAARDWLVRVVRYLAGPASIDQFLDCGSGLPTDENTHQVAQRINPEARVVYVDNDPMVIAHGRALLEENDRTHFAAADLRHPDELLRHPVVNNLDFTRPLALMQCATLHHLRDEEDPREVMAGYTDALTSGSYLVLSHFYDPADGSKYSELAHKLEEPAHGNCARRFRSREEILSYFGDLELVEPGLVALADWWPLGPRLAPLADIEYTCVGAVARKP